MSEEPDISVEVKNKPVGFVGLAQRIICGEVSESVRSSALSKAGDRYDLTKRRANIEGPGGDSPLAPDCVLIERTLEDPRG